jgi:hypothetical protein
MKIRRALIQACKVTLVLVALVAVLAVLLLNVHGFNQFSEMYLTANVAGAVLPPILLVALVTFIVSLILRK